jgi:hypothetical protein
VLRDGREEFFQAAACPAGPDCVIVCSVDAKLIDPLRRIGPIQGTFLKGDPGGTLVAMIKGQLGL